MKRKCFLLMCLTASLYAFPGQDVQLKICNNSEIGPVFMSYTWMENSVWVSRGWYQLDADPQSANHCQVLDFGPQAVGSPVYVYSEHNHGEAFWPGVGDGVYCVHRSRAFVLEHADDPHTCQDTANYKRVSGQKFYLTEGVFSDNLLPFRR